MNLDDDTADRGRLKRDLIKAVSTEMSPYGFVFDRGKGFFVRGRDGIEDQLHLVFLDRHGSLGWRIQPHMALRIERVEDIFHQTSRWDPKSQKETPTIGSEIGRILTGRSGDCEFLLDFSASIPRVATEIVEVFRKHALPYYEKFSSLREIDHALNDHPRHDTPHRIATWLRCATGLIVARLVGRPDYQRLVRIYTSQLRWCDKGFYLSRFLDLVKSLEAVKPEFEPPARPSGGIFGHWFR